MKDGKYALGALQKGKFESLFKEVLSNVKPSKSEIADAKFAINDIMGRLMKATPKDVEILLAGSVARGTQIRGNSDIDVFLLFPRKMGETKIERMGLEIAKRIVNKKKNESYIVKYAEHPYTRLFLNDLKINVDIVPAYKIENALERITAVDRTQLHNEFVNSHLNEKQRDEVRVLKAFLKAHRIYGAEAKIEGFSGYLCELLIYSYGSFLKLLTAMANIKLPVIINTSKGWKESEHSAMVKKFGKKFIVIDPTDSNRNVAANVSDNSLLRFAIVSRALLKKPDMNSFYGEKWSDLHSDRKLSETREKLGANLYVLHFDVPDIAEDIIWQQLKKSMLSFDELLARNGFNPIISLHSKMGKDALIAFFVLDAKVLVRKVHGPNLHAGDAIESFMHAHRDSIALSVENGSIYSIDKAKYTNPKEFVQGFLNSRTTKLPSYLNAKKCTIYENKIPEKYAKMVYWAYLDKFSF